MKVREEMIAFMRNHLRAWWTPQTRRQLLIALCATAAFTFLAHGFLFTNEFFSHDSVTFMYNAGFDFYLQNGRFLIPIYEYWRGGAASPWLTGALFLCWMTLASYGIICLLHIQSLAGQILLCGLLCTNCSLTLTGATYVYCMDEYALALLLAVVSSAFFLREGVRNSLPGLLPLIVCLAIYQPYFTVALSLCFLSVFLRVIEGHQLRSVFRSAVKYLLLMGAGFAAYYLLWRVLCVLSGVSAIRTEEALFFSTPANIPLQILRALARAYGKFILDMFVRGSGIVELFLLRLVSRFQPVIMRGDGVLGAFLPLLNILLLAAVLRWMFGILRDKTLPVNNRRMAAALFCLFPAVFRSISILTPASDHDLTCYAERLFYLFPIFIMEPAARKKACAEARLALSVLLCLVLWYNIVFANQAYMKKDLERNSTLVLAVRVIERIENVDGYIPGETPVVFVGSLNDNPYLNQHREAFEGLYDRVWLYENYAATYNMDLYLTRYLHYPLIIGDETELSQWETVREMPLFPETGSISMVNETVVVKFSEIKTES